jgi:hypothetical protein
MHCAQPRQKHAEWCVKLRGAITAGNRCDPGKWLYGEATQQFGCSPVYNKVSPGTLTFT